MKTSSVRTRTLTVVMAAALIVAVMGASAVAAPSSSSARNHPCVVAAGSGDQAFVRNFNPFNLGTQRDFTWGGIYENLLISTAVGGGRQYSILAKSFGWSKNGKTLTITVQPNVKWSDGKPLTAADVLYSLTIGRQDKAADRINLARPPATSRRSSSPARTRSRSSSSRSTRRSSAQCSRTSRSSPAMSGRR